MCELAVSCTHITQDLEIHGRRKISRLLFEPTVPYAPRRRPAAGQCRLSGIYLGILPRATQNEYLSIS